jgi:uncharacterized cysteine cluster protein YcgN (CxxCxxCC family)
MSEAEWESLCDSCGRCCLHKLEDEDTKEVHYTEVSCKLLDLGTCRCSNYEKRVDFVDDCVKLTPESARLRWLPRSCAYRRLVEGKKLHWWHPLVSGDPETVHSAGISVRGRAIDENKAGNLLDHIVTWPE